MRIVKITEVGEFRTIEICLADECSNDGYHKQMYHRSYTFDTSSITMPLERCCREALLLAREELKRINPPKPKEIPKEEVERSEKLVMEQIEKDALRIRGNEGVR